MEGLVKEYANFLNDDKKPASEKFWELEKRIKESRYKLQIGYIKNKYVRGGRCVCS